MQFRIVQGKHKSTIQFIRSVYDKAQKPQPRKIKTLDGQEVMVAGARRSTQTLVGSMRRHDKKPTDEQVKNLTVKERTKLAKFLSDLHDKDLSAHRYELIYAAPFNLKELTDAIGSVLLFPNVEAIKIWEGIAAIQKALIKAGYPKPARSKSKQAEDDFMPHGFPAMPSQR